MTTAIDRTKRQSQDLPPDLPGVFILLPVLNEIATIGPLLDRIEAALGRLRYTVGLLDDGSTDGTVEYVEGRMAAPDHRLHLIRRQKRGRGSQRGSALHTLLVWGLENTDHQVFVEMDGDLSHRPEELLHGIQMVAAGACDVAIASKYLPGSRVLNRPLSRRLVSQVCSFAVRLLLSRKIRDYSNGFRFYHRMAARLIADHKIRYGSPIYLSEVVAVWLRHGLAIVEFPTVYVGRNEGISKLRPVDLLKASAAIFEIAFRLRVAGFEPVRTLAVAPAACGVSEPLSRL